MRYQYISNGLLVLILAAIIVGCGGNRQQESASSGDTSQTTIEQQQTAITDTTSESVQKLNLNTTPEEEFKTIPGVGDQMAHEFEEYRPYVSIQQFRKEIGKYVDEDQVAAYEQYVFVPIDPNECDAATLQQIPGLEAEDADALISERPYDSNQAFLDQLSQYVSEQQLATAKTYLVSE